MSIKTRLHLKRENAPALVLLAAVVLALFIADMQASAMFCFQNGLPLDCTPIAVTLILTLIHTVILAFLLWVAFLLFRKTIDELRGLLRLLGSR